MDQFTQMKATLSSFLGPRQETTRTAFCYYLASDVEALEERESQTYRNEAVKLQSRILRRAEERMRQPQQPTLSRSSSATSTAGREYILTIPWTCMPASQVIQPAQQSQVAPRGQQQPKGQPTSFVVVEDQQPVPSRLITFTNPDEAVQPTISCLCHR